MVCGDMGGGDCDGDGGGPSRLGQNDIFLDLGGELCPKYCAMSENVAYLRASSVGCRGQIDYYRGRKA